AVAVDALEGRVILDEGVSAPSAGAETLRSRPGVAEAAKSKRSGASRTTSCTWMSSKRSTQQTRAWLGRGAVGPRGLVDHRGNAVAEAVMLDVGERVEVGTRQPPLPPPMDEVVRERVDVRLSDIRVRLEVGADREERPRITSLPPTDRDEMLQRI